MHTHVSQKPSLLTCTSNLQGCLSDYVFTYKDFRTGKKDGGSFLGLE